MERCLECNELKDLEAKGLCGRCYKHLHYLNNKEKYRQRTKKRLREKKEEVKEYERIRYLARKDDVKARARAWEKANPEKALARRRLWRAKNKESILNYFRRYREKHRDYFRAKSRMSNYKIRPDYDLKTVERVVLDNLLRYGEICCEKCKAVVPDTYHIDHIVPISKDGGKEYENLQVLCGPCNRRKYTTIVDHRDIPERGQLSLGGNCEF